MWAGTEGQVASLTSIKVNLFGIPVLSGVGSCELQWQHDHVTCLHLAAVELCIVDHLAGWLHDWECAQKLLGGFTNDFWIVDDSLPVR
jgi:hypothetical protein